MITISANNNYEPRLKVEPFGICNKLYIFKSYTYDSHFILFHLET